ncbi:hypothetical protein HanRHA438_Chr09g0403221 [Helianthus annuus]|nr:hypothetical protein HanRHA438_Chr09g0403221 [Helianthus annuus]
MVRRSFVLYKPSNSITSLQHCRQRFSPPTAKSILIGSRRFRDEGGRLSFDWDCIVRFLPPSSASV